MSFENITEKIEAVIEASKKTGVVDRFLALISYLGILSLVPVVLKVRNEFSHFHMRQGLVLFIAEIVFTLIWVIPMIGWIIGFLGWICCLALSIAGIVNAIIGRKWQMPVISRFTDKIKI